MVSGPGRLVLLGSDVSGSLSPIFQNAALDAAGIALRYEPLSVPASAFAECVAELVHSRAAGNVTIPHKQRMAALCDALTPIAARAAAVNTFWCDRDGRLVGDNTDPGGFQALAHAVLGTVPRNARVALLGAGGAAAAVLVALDDWPGVRVHLHARTPARAEALARRIGVPVTLHRSAEEASAGAEIVVNATPAGMRDDDHPVELDSLLPGAALLDLVYRRGETDWVRAARRRGHPAADGLTMLVEQGALAFERWFGSAPDRDAMWRAVR